MFLKIVFFSLLVTAAMCSDGANMGDEDMRKKTTSTTSPPPTTTTLPTTTSTIPPIPTTNSTTPTTPATTTTVAPTTPSTAPTTPSPTPTPSPSPTPTPSDAQWVVRNQTDGSVCLMLKAGLQLDIPYKMVNDKIGNAKVMLEKTANVTGMCNITSEMMELSGENLTISIDFKVNKTSKQYWLSNISASIPLPSALFPNASSNTSLKLVYAGREFVTPLNNSYTCNSELQLNLEVTNSNRTARLSLKELKFEAFHEKSEPKFSSAFECEKDHETPDIVPIAVGVAIAVLIVAVLVAYLVSRRRTQARGYLSM